jgi:hypothetical protein
MSSTRPDILVSVDNTMILVYGSANNQQIATMDTPPNPSAAIAVDCYYSLMDRMESQCASSLRSRRTLAFSRDRALVTAAIVLSQILLFSTMNGQKLRAAVPPDTSSSVSRAFGSELFEFDIVSEALIHSCLKFTSQTKDFKAIATHDQKGHRPPDSHFPSLHCSIKTTFRDLFHDIGDHTVFKQLLILGINEDDFS